MIEATPRFSNQLPMRIGWVRLLSVTVPLLYAGGAAIDSYGIGPKDGVIGNFLVIIAMVTTVVGLQLSGVHRLVWEKADFLDIVERKVREETLARAYVIFTSVTVAAAFALELTFSLNRKFDWQLPTVDNGMVLTSGAMILFAMLLPSALLAWRLPVAEPDMD